MRALFQRPDRRTLTAWLGAFMRAAIVFWLGGLLYVLALDLPVSNKHTFWIAMLVTPFLAGWWAGKPLPAAVAPLALACVTVIGATTFRMGGIAQLLSLTRYGAPTWFVGSAALAAAAGAARGKPGAASAVLRATFTVWFFALLAYAPRLINSADDIDTGYWGWLLLAALLVAPGLAGGDARASFGVPSGVFLAAITMEFVEPRLDATDYMFTLPSWPTYAIWMGVVAVVGYSAHRWRSRPKAPAALTTSSA